MDAYGTDLYRIVSDFRAGRTSKAQFREQLSELWHKKNRLYGEALAAKRELDAREDEYFALWEELEDPDLPHARFKELTERLIFKAERAAKSARIKFQKAADADTAAREGAGIFHHERTL